jgi:hypothetical protein
MPKYGGPRRRKKCCEGRNWSFVSSYFVLGVKYITTCVKIMNVIWKRPLSTGEYILVKF